MRDLRTLLRRPRWLTRPVVVVVAAVISLGGLGGAAGMLFGELGAAGSAMHLHEGHHRDDPFRGAGRPDNDADDGPGAVFSR